MPSPPSDIGLFSFFSGHPGKPLVLVSSCLMGNKVRYDGKHKRNATLIHSLVQQINPLVVCPEAMAGLGIPRPPVALINTGAALEARGRNDPALNVTAPLVQMALIQNRAHPLLAGALLQSRSPSCGVNSTPQYDSNGRFLGVGAGLFAGTLLHERPWLPVLEDTAFEVPRQVEIFLLKAYLCADWLYLSQTTPHVWQWALDFFRHHEGVIECLPQEEAQQLAALFTAGTTAKLSVQTQQIVDIFLVGKAADALG